MLIDTHTHINMMVKKKFDTPMNQEQYQQADLIVQQAATAGVKTIINVGTSLVESINGITIAMRNHNVFATVGIHPNDCTIHWLNELKKLTTYIKKKEYYKIVAIGETGIDKHYPDLNLQRQKEAFKAHIELALEYNLALVVHTRDAHDETLRCLDEFNGQISRGVIHCYSDNLTFANHVIAQGFVLGIGGALTYPKNDELQILFSSLPLEKIILETDAPFLPPQSIRGKQNHPREITTIAQFLAQLRQEPFEKIAQQTTVNAQTLFNLGNI